MTALSELLNNAKADINIDARIASAHQAGHKIHRATVYKALEGDHAKTPSEKTLKGLAAVFGLDIRHVRAAAGKPAGELGPWTPPDESAQLSQPIRDALDNLIKSIASEGGGERGQGGSAPIVPLRPLGPHEVNEAAYDPENE